MIADDLCLPRVDEPPPNLTLLIVGKALAETYRATLDEPLPEGLAHVMRLIEERATADGNNP